MSQTRGKLVAIVSPVYNEGANIRELILRIRGVMEPLPYDYRIVLVNDGSGEETTQILDAAAEGYCEVSVIHLSRNFGHQAALSAGLDEAWALRASATITMDSDLQHPPTLIGAMLGLWEQGYQVVYTIRDDSVRTSYFKRVTSAFFYLMIGWISERVVPRGAADFRLLDGAALEALVSMPERARFLRGLTAWIGFRQVGLPYIPDARFSGQPKYTLLRMVRLAVDGLVSMTTLPLQFVILLGGLVSFVSLVYLSYIVFAHFFTNRTLPGWSSVMVSVLFLGGMILTVLGVIGIYLAKIYEEVKGRPLYVIQRRHALTGNGKPLERKCR